MEEVHVELGREAEYEKEDEHGSLYKIESISLRFGLLSTPCRFPLKIIVKLGFHGSGKRPECGSRVGRVKNWAQLFNTCGMPCEWGSQSPSSNEVSSITIVKKLHDIQFEILDRKLALLYSGQGKKRKLPFCCLKLFEAIVVGH
ncbi:hypothetical protein HUJ05_001218 [Dendroctonus ponderosae]|nr:hypothetical protein HUJ05_001218 [Dendroctonus ponderosae]